MANRAISHVKLGIFALSGLLFLVLLLYMIGKNKNLFGKTYVLKARFENVQGLVAGNNVRYSGIETGTVKKIRILSDTVIEVSMVIDKDMQSIIRRNAIVSIGTDGLVGNKVVNIVPSRQSAPLAQDGDVLATREAVDTEDMLQTLHTTNNDIALIASDLKETIYRIKTSNALWTLLNDESIPQQLRIAAVNIRSATEKASGMAGDLEMIVGNIKNGKGSLGTILTDTSFARNLDDAVSRIKQVGEQADLLAAQVNTMVAALQHDLDSGKGLLNTLLQDSSLARKLNTSLENIQKGTDGFNQNMEALKHTFLLRGYFRKQEKKKKQAADREPF